MQKLKVSIPKYTSVGDTSTPNFQLVSDGTLAGDKAVAAMAAVCEQDYTTLKGIFGKGDVPGLPFVVTVDPQAGGAYHQTCQDTGIHLIPQDAASLLVAELVECFEAQGGAIDCGYTCGEGLSRALAIEIRPFQVLTGLDGDIQGWWNGGQPADYFNDNSQDDQNDQANACGTLGWFYLVHELGYNWDVAVNTGKSTLGDIGAALTGKTGQQVFQDFVNILKPLNGNINDNPFPIGNPTPTPTPQGKGCLLFGLLG